MEITLSNQIDKDYKVFIDNYLNLWWEYHNKGVEIGDIFSAYSCYNKEILDRILLLVENQVNKLEDDLGVVLNDAFYNFMVLYMFGRNESLVGEDLVTVKGTLGETYSMPIRRFDSNCLRVMEILRSFVRNKDIYFYNGKIKKFNNKFDPSDFKSLKKAAQNNEYNTYEAIVLRNGDIYFVSTDHETLARKLMATGEELQGAIRINQPSSSVRRFLLSSLYLYRNSFDGLEGEKQILVTEKQVRTIKAYYDCLYGRGQIYGEKIESILHRSENLGWSFMPFSETVTKEDFNLRNAKLNLMEFERVFGISFDSIEFYERVKEEYRLRMARLQHADEDER